MRLLITGDETFLKTHILVLEGQQCKPVVKERFQAFLRHLGETLGLTIEPMAGSRWNAPNPGVLSRDGGAFAWSFWSDASAVVTHDVPMQTITLCLQTGKYIGFSDADVLFRWYFSPQEIRNCMPILSGPKG